MPLPCPHPEPRDRRACVHLADGDHRSHYLRFTGQGTDYWLTCEPCADAADPPLAPTCEACFREREGRILDASGIRGRPEVRSRPSTLRFTHQPVAIPGLPAGPIPAIAPLLGDDRGAWLAVLGGVLTRIDLDPPRLTPILPLPSDAGLDLAAPLRIDPSPDGRFAAAVNLRGRRGLVIDLAAARVTMRLDRGDYHEEHCEFSAAFFLDRGRPLLVHATGWNRLDVSDPADGTLLTPRGPTERTSHDEPEPPHYLDYFHAGLTASPNGRWLADDGWVWHPVGVLRSFDLRRWLRDDPWEPEDGASVRELRACEWYWDGPRCFADDRTLITWGFGPDVDALLDAVVLYDVATGERLRWFAGPPRGRLVLDRHLLVFAESGATAWDLATGERLLDAPGFAPAAFHPATRVHLSSAEDGSLVASRLAE